MITVLQHSGDASTETTGVRVSNRNLYLGNAVKSL